MIKKTSPSVRQLSLLGNQSPAKGLHLLLLQVYKGAFNGLVSYHYKWNRSNLIWKGM
jgi:hypothetical protein